MTFEEFKNIVEKIGINKKVWITLSLYSDIQSLTKIEAKFQKENNNIYICQNRRDGAICKKKLGYRYSWKVLEDADIDKYSSMSILSIVPFGKEVTMKNAKFGVKYDRSGDPVEFFETKKLAEKRVEELLDDRDVNKTSIFLFEVGDVYEIKRPASFELVKLT